MTQHSEEEDDDLLMEKGIDDDSDWMIEIEANYYLMSADDDADAAAVSPYQNALTLTLQNAALTLTLTNDFFWGVCNNDWPNHNAAVADGD